MTLDPLKPLPHLDPRRRFAPARPPLFIPRRPSLYVPRRPLRNMASWITKRGAPVTRAGLVVTTDTGCTTPVCYQARKCEDNTLAGLYYCPGGGGTLSSTIFARRASDGKCYSISPPDAVTGVSDNFGAFTSLTSCGDGTCPCDPPCDTVPLNQNCLACTTAGDTHILNVIRCVLAGTSIGNGDNGTCAFTGCSIDGTYELAFDHVNGTDCYWTAVGTVTGCKTTNDGFNVPCCDPCTASQNLPNVLVQLRVARDGGNPLNGNFELSAAVFTGDARFCPPCTDTGPQSCYQGAFCGSIITPEKAFLQGVPITIAGGGCVVFGSICGGVETDAGGAVLYACR